MRFRDLFALDCMSSTSVCDNNLPFHATYHNEQIAVQQPFFDAVDHRYHATTPNIKFGVANFVFNSYQICNEKVHTFKNII